MIPKQTVLWSRAVKPLPFFSRGYTQLLFFVHIYQLQISTRCIKFEVYLALILQSLSPKMYKIAHQMGFSK